MNEQKIIKTFQRLNYKLRPKSLEILISVWEQKEFSEQFLRELTEKVALIMEEGKYDESIFIEEHVVKETLKLLKLNDTQTGL